MILSKEKKKRVIVLFFEYMKEARDSVEYSVQGSVYKAETCGERVVIVGGGGESVVEVAEEVWA